MSYEMSQVKKSPKVKKNKINKTKKNKNKKMIVLLLILMIFAITTLAQDQEVFDIVLNISDTSASDDDNDDDDFAEIGEVGYFPMSDELRKEDEYNEFKGSTEFLSAIQMLKKDATAAFNHVDFGEAYFVLENGNRIPFEGDDFDLSLMYEPIKSIQIDLKSEEQMASVVNAVFPVFKRFYASKCYNDIVIEVLVELLSAKLPQVEK